MAKIDRFIKVIQEEADWTPLKWKVSYRHDRKKNYDILLRTGEIGVHFSMGFDALLNLRPDRYGDTAQRIIIQALQEMQAEEEQ
jgi:hypothetical protein